MITDAQIEEAKKNTQYSLSKPVHKHNDRIRIAYEWLDAQKKIKTSKRRLFHGVKHLIEAWAGRYISTSDVEVAATLHPDIQGEYPSFNLSSRLTEPALSRLNDIKEVLSHEESSWQEQCPSSHDPKDYKMKE